MWFSLFTYFTSDLLTFTIHQALWGTLIYQEWIHLFNMDKPTSLKLPRWMTLHMLPLELHPFKVKIVPQIDKVLGINSNDLQFCIALALEERWTVHLFIMGKHHVFLFIKVDHEKYPIQCHFLINLCHLVHDYPILNARNKMAWLIFTLHQIWTWYFLTCVSYSTYKSNLPHDSSTFHYWVVKLACNFLFKGVLFQNPIEDFFPTHNQKSFVILKHHNQESHFELCMERIQLPRFSKSLMIGVE